eukprot:4181726-Alexandrium_andersonii.AAC.1
MNTKLVSLPCRLSSQVTLAACVMPTRLHPCLPPHSKGSMSRCAGCAVVQLPWFEGVSRGRIMCGDA